MALNWFKKLKTGLSKSASKVEGAIASITGKKTIDQETIDDIEDQLILADLGIEVASRICLLYTSPSPRDGLLSRMPSSA